MTWPGRGRNNRGVLRVGLMVLVLSSSFLGCGDDEERRLLPGAFGGPLNIDGSSGTLIVDSVHEVDGSPVREAAVLIGLGDEAQVVGQTDSSGHLVVSPDGLGWPAAVTVAPEDGPPTCWVGVVARHLVVPVPPAQPPAPQLRANVAIEGWEALQPGPDADYLLAVVASQRRLDMRNLGEAIERTSGNPACQKPKGQREPCSFDVDGEEGAEVAAMIFEGADRGVLGDPTDDDFAPVGFAQSSITDEGSTRLQLVEAVTHVTIETLAFPDSFARSRAYLGMGYRDGFGLVFPLPFGAPIRDFIGPSRPDNARLWFIGAASNAVQGQSTLTRRSAGVLQDSASSVVLDRWLEPARSLVVEGGSLRFEPDPTARLHRIEFDCVESALCGRVLIVDGSSSIDLPPVFDLSSLEQVRLTSFVATVDTAGFSLQEVFDSAVRSATSTWVP